MAGLTDTGKISGTEPPIAAFIVPRREQYNSRGYSVSIP